MNLILFLSSYLYHIIILNIYCASIDCKTTILFKNNDNLASAFSS